MVKDDIEEIRGVWLRDGDAEAKLWLAHVDRRTQEILGIYANEERIPIFEMGDLLFNVFSYLNWLAHVHYRQDRYVPEDSHPRGHDMISFLEGVTQWPRDVCAAFWLCVRNPIMHTGRASLFADYQRKASSGHRMYADLHPNLTFDPAQFQPDEFKPTVANDGYTAIAGAFDDERRLDIWFYFPGVRRKLEDARTLVIEGIANADDQSIKGLRKINMKTLAFRVVGVDDENQGDTLRPSSGLSDFRCNCRWHG